MHVRVFAYLKAFVASFSLIIFVSQPAATLADSGRHTVEIGNDIGGSLQWRLNDLDAKRKAGLSLRIVGDVCYSSCTLYLGLPGTCISPTTMFGFHGPSSYGKALAPEHFEQASQVIVAHYPPVLQEWYMTVARYELRGLLKVSGRKLHSIGAARLCADAT